MTQTQMKPVAVQLLKYLVGVLLLALSTIGQAEVIDGKVVGVLDGDTIDVLDAAHVKHRIRLAGIDAPEKRQAYGEKSKQSLSDMVFGEQVQVEAHKRDRYGRRVGKVLVNGQDANLQQISLGMAWFYRQYESELSPDDRSKYAGGELSARQNRLGLWADKNPVPPWGFRRQ